MTNTLPGLAIALSMSVPSLASPQAAGDNAASPPLRHRSAFDDDKPTRDIAPGDWRGVNVTVAGAPGGASGHAGHRRGGLRAIQPPAAPASTAAPKPARNPPPMNEGHALPGVKK